MQTESMCESIRMRRRGFVTRRIPQPPFSLRPGAFQRVAETKVLL